MVLGDDDWMKTLIKVQSKVTEVIFWYDDRMTESLTMTLLRVIVSKI